MVKRLYCGVRVVLNITLVVWLASTSPLFAQSSSPQFIEITLSCQGISLETALEKVSQKAGIFFIYSPSLLDLNKTVSFSAQRQPLNKLLDRLGREMNLSFRYEGKYVIIKKSELVRTTEIKSSTSSANISLLASANASGSSISSISQQKHIEYLSTLTSFTPFSPVPVKVPQLTSMKPLEIITPKGIMHKQWFASVGLISNGYTNGGAEVRGGLKPLYGVVNFGLLNQGRYRLGYGLGTAASVSDKLSFNLIYNYGRINGQNDIVLKTETDHFLVERNYKVGMKHNQMKVMLQYNVHPRFHVNFGASFNLLTTNYQLQNVFESPSVIATFTSSGVLRSSGANYIFNEGNSISPAAPMERTYQTTRTWVGWEAGVFYRINF